MAGTAGRRLSSNSHLPSMNPSPNLDISQDVLGNLSETMGLTSLALSLALESVDNLKANMIIAALYTLFVGLFTPLTALAAYVLFSKGIGRRISNCDHAHSYSPHVDIDEGVLDCNSHGGDGVL
ncbi:hypothetical protein OH76DRAFT_1402616 [Lentinus brumalis]|uniref:Uncharacterized protein n=1 Tax=Lentinus brumalis TaxID=2498619 RepID=A0A371DDC7_9APHY|nr:hypothetical protein OH76DRAFT_1402616 [Polyporus brumalis]